MKPIIGITNLPTNFLNPKHTKRKAQGQHSAILVVALVGCLLPAGCTGLTYSSHFDCPMGEGAGCASLSKVNKMIDRQEIDLGNDDIPSSRGPVGNEGGSSAESRPHALGNQVYVYYGPDQLGRPIPADGLETRTAGEVAFGRGSIIDREPTFGRGSATDQEGS